jgi:hypothetical protein
MGDAYPPIYYLPKILTDNGRTCLAVVVPGSDNRPHFAGPSYVRVGSESRAASEEQFDRLVAERVSESREILKWRGKEITLFRIHRERNEVASTASCTVIDCNRFYVTLQHGQPQKYCVPLNRISISIRSCE